MGWDEQARCRGFLPAPARESNRDVGPFLVCRPADLNLNDVGVEYTDPAGRAR
jgi:hypothetical protein